MIEILHFIGLCPDNILHLNLLDIIIAEPNLSIYLMKVKNKFGSLKKISTFALSIFKQ